MALSGDYHTHTKYSRRNHGKGTVEENVKAAVEKGLSQIAITDHGFNQILYGVRRSDMAKMREEIESARERYPIEILQGVEANLISANGDIDVVESDYENLDILLCGYHKLVKGNRKRDGFFIFTVGINGFQDVQKRLGKLVVANEGLEDRGAVYSDGVQKLFGGDDTVMDEALAREGVYASAVNGNDVAWGGDIAIVFNVNGFNARHDVDKFVFIVPVRLKIVMFGGVVPIGSANVAFAKGGTFKIDFDVVIHIHTSF